jgi:hypothetical protein
MAANNGYRQYAEINHLVHGLVLREKRDPRQVARVLQTIHDHSDFFSYLAQLYISDPEAESIMIDINDWLEFYHGVGITIDESKLEIPPPPVFPHWAVIAHPAFMPNQGYAEMQNRFSAWKITNDLDIFKRITLLEKPRVFYIRARVEADEELKKMSAEMVWKADIQTLGFPERMALECIFFEKTEGAATPHERHLDRINWTLCSGFRDPDGRVPLVRWYSSAGGVGVYWCFPLRADGVLRSRQKF